MGGIPSRTSRRLGLSPRRRHRQPVHLGQDVQSAYELWFPQITPARAGAADCVQARPDRLAGGRSAPGQQEHSRSSHDDRPGTRHWGLLALDQAVADPEVRDVRVPHHGPVRILPLDRQSHDVKRRRLAGRCDCHDVPQPRRWGAQAGGLR